MTKRRGSLLSPEPVPLLLEHVVLPPSLSQNVELQRNEDAQSRLEKGGLARDQRECQLMRINPTSAHIPEYPEPCLNGDRIVEVVFRGGCKTTCAAPDHLIWTVPETRGVTPPLVTELWYAFHETLHWSTCVSCTCTALQVFALLRRNGSCAAQ